MANVDIAIQFTTDKAMEALESLQRRLKETQAMIGNLNKTGAKGIDLDSNSAKKATSNINGTTNAIKDLGKETKNTSNNLKGLDSSGIDKMEKKVEDLKKKMEFKPSGGGMGNIGINISKAFSRVGDEIVRSTKLLTAFGVVAGGVTFNRAKNEFLDYSKNIVGLQNVTGANTPESKAILDKMISNISSRTGTKGSETIANIVDTASGGITVNLGGPNAQANAKSFEEIQTKIGLFGKAFATESKDVNKAVVALGASLGKSAEDLNKPKEVDELLGLLAISLKNGVGSLSEYTTAIPKFIATYTAGAKTDIERKALAAEALAIFTTKTLSASPAMAGFTTRSFGEDLGNMLRQSKASSTKITNLLKEKKDSEGNTIPFTFLGDKEKTRKVQQFLNPFENADYMRRQIFLNKQGVQGTQLEVAQNISSVLARGESETGIKKGELLSLFTTNTNTRKALLAFMDQQDTIATLAKEFGGPGAGQDYVNQSIKNVEGSFSMAYSKVSADFNNLTNDIGNKLSPSLNAVSGLLSNMMTGGTSDMVKFNKTFQENYDVLKNTNPMLAKMVSIMRDFGNYVGTGKAKKDFEAMVQGVEDIVDAMRQLKDIVMFIWDGPLKGIRDILGGGALGAIAEYSALKVGLTAAVTGAFSLAGAALKVPFMLAGTSAGVAAGEAMAVSAKSTGFLMGTSLLGALGSITAWAAIGVMLGDSAYSTWRKLTDADKKEEERVKIAGDIISTSATIGTNVLGYNSLTEEKRKEERSKIFGETTRTYDLGMFAGPAKDFFKDKELGRQLSNQLVHNRTSLADIEQIVGKENTKAFLTNMASKGVVEHKSLNIPSFLGGGQIQIPNILGTGNLPKDQTSIENLITTLDNQAKIDSQASADSKVTDGLLNTTLQSLIGAINNLPSQLQLKVSTQLNIPGNIMNTSPSGDSVNKSKGLM